MENEQLALELFRLNIEYHNGLEYIRNNPYISVSEVQDHLKVIKERKTILELIDKNKGK